METPKWNTKLLSARNVYEPAEDTFLLLDALENDIENLMKINPHIILEIGPGSGIIIAALASVLKSRVQCFAIDINPDACIVTRNTAELNNVTVEVLNGNLLKAFQLRESIDVIIFNPPYVRTVNIETFVEGISQSWAGGENGRKIIDDLLPVLSKAISLNGVFYLVAVSYNNIEDLFTQMKVFGFVGKILKSRQVPGELLYVLKFKKTTNVVSGCF